MGIIGVGNIGSAHAACIYRGEIAGMCLTALCDTDPVKRAYLQESYPDVPIFENHGELLESGLTDGIIVSTPHRFHPQIAKDGFNAGQHVLSEKPAGVFFADAAEMISSARRSGRTFGIMFNQRTDPLFCRAREIVKSGRLGEPKRLVWIITNWYRTQEYYDSGSWRATWNGEGGGVLLNQAPHNLDLWQWIFGMPERIRAFCYPGKYHNIAVEDDATLYAEYASGATAVFITSTGEYPGTNRLEISGDRGKIVVEKGRLVFSELSEQERRYCFSSAGRPAPSVGDTVFKETIAESGHKLILRNFAKAALYGEELIAPGQDGINELMLSNAAYLSSWTDGWVTLPPDKDLFEKLLAERIKKEDFLVKTSSDNISGKSGYRDRWQVKW